MNKTPKARSTKMIGNTHQRLLDHRNESNSAAIPKRRAAIRRKYIVFHTPSRCVDEMIGQSCFQDCACYDLKTQEIGAHSAVIVQRVDLVCLIWEITFPCSVRSVGTAARRARHNGAVELCLSIALGIGLPKVVPRPPDRPVFSGAAALAGCTSIIS